MNLYIFSNALFFPLLQKKRENGTFLTEFIYFCIHNPINNDIIIYQP